MHSYGKLAANLPSCALLLIASSTALNVLQHSLDPLNARSLLSIYQASLLFAFPVGLLLGAYSLLFLFWRDLSSKSLRHKMRFITGKYCTYVSISVPAISIILIAPLYYLDELSALAGLLFCYVFLAAASKIWYGLRIRTSMKRMAPKLHMAAHTAKIDRMLMQKITLLAFWNGLLSIMVLFALAWSLVAGWMYLKVELQLALALIAWLGALLWEALLVKTFWPTRPIANKPVASSPHPSPTPTPNSSPNRKKANTIASAISERTEESPSNKADERRNSKSQNVTESEGSLTSVVSASNSTTISRRSSNDSSHVPSLALVTSAHHHPQLGKVSKKPSLKNRASTILKFIPQIPTKPSSSIQTSSSPSSPIDNPPPEQPSPDIGPPSSSDHPPEPDPPTKLDEQNHFFPLDVRLPSSSIQVPDSAYISPADIPPSPSSLVQEQPSPGTSPGPTPSFTPLLVGLKPKRIDYTISIADQKERPKKRPTIVIPVQENEAKITLEDGSSVSSSIGSSIGSSVSSSIGSSIGKDIPPRESARKDEEKKEKLSEHKSTEKDDKQGNEQKGQNITPKSDSGDDSEKQPTSDEAVHLPNRRRTPVVSPRLRVRNRTKGGRRSLIDYVRDLVEVPKSLMKVMSLDLTDIHDMHNALQRDEEKIVLPKEKVSRSNRPSRKPFPDSASSSPSLQPSAQPSAQTSSRSSIELGELRVPPSVDIDKIDKKQPTPPSTLENKEKLHRDGQGERRRSTPRSRAHKQTGWEASISPTLPTLVESPSLSLSMDARTFDQSGSGSGSGDGAGGPRGSVGPIDDNDLEDLVVY